jgi:hypothetical protein
LAKLKTVKYEETEPEKEEIMIIPLNIHKSAKNLPPEA